MLMNSFLNTFESNIAKKLEIIRLFNDGFNERYIAKETGIPKTTVHKTISKYRNNATIMRINGSGRPKILNDEDITYLENLIVETPNLSSKKIANLLERERKKVISARTISNELNKLVITQEYHERYLAYLQETFAIEMKLQENGQIGL